MANSSQIASLQHPFRQLVRVPRERCRQRLGLEVIVERGQARPARIVAQQFHHTCQEHEPEQQPAQQPQHDARARGQKHGEKARLQQQQVPLEGGEHLPGVNERKIQDEQHDQRGALQEAQGQRNRGHGARHAHDAQRRIRSIEPEDRRNLPIALRPEVLCRGGKEILQRQDAVAADQSRRLPAEGDEREQVDQPQPAQEESCGERVLRRIALGTPQPYRGPVQGIAVARDVAIGELGDGGEARQPAVEPPSQAAARRKGQHAHACGGAARDCAVAIDKLHGA